jgi:hypothetical protein
VPGQCPIGLVISVTEILYTTAGLVLAVGMQVFSLAIGNRNGDNDGAVVLIY